MTSPADSIRTDDLFSTDVLSSRVFDRPAQVLVIDSDAAERTQLVTMLEQSGHSVETAGDGREGLKTAAEQRPDVILLDLALSDMDAFEFCRRIRGDDKLQYVSVIILTALKTTEAHVRGLEAGANDFISKPVDPAIFAARVRSQVKYRRAMSALRRARTELETRVQERTAQLTAANEALENEIAEHKQTEKALHDSEERYKLSARGANDGLWDWDLSTNEIYYSDRWKEMMGFKSAEISNSTDEWFSRVHHEDLAQLKGEIAAHLDGITEHLRCEYRIHHKDGTLRWMLVRGMAVRDGLNRAYRMAGSQSDITTRKVVELQLRHDAFHDGLTGLPNRALFSDRLGQAIARMKRHDNYLFAVLLLDLDRFSMVNDSLGHSIGDHLLIEFARRIKKCPRPADTVARMGGDEFAILLDDIAGIEEAHQIANKIHHELRAPITLHNRQLFVTTSVGIAMGRMKYQRPDEVLRDADTALYHAKALGLARQHAFSSGMHAKVLSLLDLESDLRRAVERQEFEVYYQPIVNLNSGKTTGFEALLRWNHPERGLVRPAEFIGIAEETELITPMTLMGLRQACTQLKQWEKLFPDRQIDISVNISGKTFSHSNLTPQIAEILGQSGVAPQRLKVEITEGTLMQDARFAEQMISQLKAMDVQLYIDDFGTGYSSLSYLHQLPLDALKIDRSFVSSMDQGGKNSEIVKTIALLANTLNMKTVAEGVETKEQLKHVRELNCDYCQGYYISKPVDGNTATKFLMENTTW